MDKPVRILVGFAPGGTADLIARVVADKLKDTIGQPVVVENRPGAIGRITADAVKAAAPDGSTIMVMPIGPMAVVPHTLKGDHVTIRSRTSRRSASARHSSSRSRPDPGAARRHGPNSSHGRRRIPAKRSTRHPAAGSLPHFVGVLLSRDIGVDMVHVAVQGLRRVYRTISSAARCPRRSTPWPISRSCIARARIRMLATTGAARAPAIARRADVQRARAQERRRYRLVRLLRAGRRRRRRSIDTLNRGINKALTSPDVVERLTKLGMDPATSTPEEFARIVASDYAKWGPIVKASGFTAD